MGVDMTTANLVRVHAEYESIGLANCSALTPRSVSEGIKVEVALAEKMRGIASRGLSISTEPLVNSNLSRS